MRNNDKSRLINSSLPYVNKSNNIGLWNYVTTLLNLQRGHPTDPSRPHFEINRARCLDHGRHGSRGHCQSVRPLSAPQLPSSP